MHLGFVLRVDRDASIVQGSSTCDLFISYDASTTTGKTMGYIRRFMYNEGGDRTYMLSPDSYSSEVWDDDDITNKGIDVKVDSAVTSGSIDTLVIISSYWIYEE